MRRPRSRTLPVIAISLGLSGCGLQNPPTSVGTDITHVDRIRNDSRLTPQEQRDALAALGFDETTINGLLNSVRLGNQYGGDLQSAYGKVVGDELNMLTPDEIQAYGDATNVTTYSDAEAQRIATFFGANGIGSMDMLRDFLDNTSLELPSGVDQQNLRDTFVDFNPSDVLSNL